MLAGIRRRDAYASGHGNLWQALPIPAVIRLGCWTRTTAKPEESLVPKIGVQAMMLKQQVADRGAFAVWKQLADIGFSVVEVSQVALTPETRDEIAKANDEFGMSVAAISAGMGETGGGGNDSLRESFDKVVADARALGTDRVRIGMMPLPALASTETLLSFVHDTNEMARRLADEGIILSYHNHHIEFARIDGRHILDLIRAEAPDLRFELDVHWIQRGGMDPVAVLTRCT
jgi:sugar phosphate isomerase/epimerase